MRFQEFEDEWEEKKLGDIATNKSGKFNPTSARSSIKCIELEHLVSESGQLIGYIDGSQSGSIKNIFNKGDVLFGKLRPYLRKYLQAPFDGVCSSEIWVLKANGVTNDFLYQIVQTDKFIDLANQSSGSKMPRADWSVVEKGIFFLPTITEQQKISRFFSLLDSRITTQSKIIEDFQSLKQTLTKKIFSQQIKFKNADGNIYPDWQEKKLGEVTIAYNNRNKDNEKLPVYSINNKLGFVPQNEQFDGIDSDERGYDIKLYKVIDKNTFAYNPARINVGSIGYSGELKNIIVSSLYVCFRTTDAVNDCFLFQYLKTELFGKQVLQNVEGGVRDYLFYDNFSRIKFHMPCVEEQFKIANFLSALDDKVKIETNLLWQLESQKKYLLRKLFI